MSDASARAEAFVSAHLAEAHELGERLAGLTADPPAFLACLRAGLRSLADPAFTAMARRASPGADSDYVVRAPLVDVVQRPLGRALREGSSIPALQLAQQLIGAEDRDLRLFALPCLRRSLPQDPEQTWQLLRRMGRACADWIEVDSLADLWARGVLAEPFRWAELEQLLYSDHTYERRLVGATLATIPHRLPAARRSELRGAAVERALEMVRQLMGDAEPMVQKALSWALREWTLVDADAVADLLEAETTLAAESRDGARAWVIRDALGKQSRAHANELRARLEGIRRDPRVPSTSIASAQTVAFATALATSHEAVATQGDRYTRSRA